jgi:hypothetical protein
MARFSYSCPDHGEFTVSLDKRAKVCDCPICKKESTPVLKCGTVRVTEIVDNGAMVRRVERLYNIDEVMRERSKKFSPPPKETEDT